MGGLKKVYINKSQVEAQINTILETHPVNDDNLNAWLIKAVTVIDLTTLSGDDTRSNVFRLCVKVRLETHLSIQNTSHKRTICLYSPKG